ncbi:right-handed parallel beta-helix repeat-containing protein, partial [bacterium]|nr:right-handed parallel beta-helix repeat-containing protein [bacterium]
LYNRDTVVRNCTTRDVGAGSATTRIRTGGHFINCHFEDVYLKTEFENSHHPTRARNFVLENCYIRANEHGRIRFDASVNPKVIGCTLDNTYVLGSRGYNPDPSKDPGAKAIYLDGNSWVNMSGNIIELEHGSEAWLFGDSSRNGSAENLSDWVEKDASSTIHYSVPPTRELPPAITEK